MQKFPMKSSWWIAVICLLSKLVEFHHFPSAESLITFVTDQTFAVVAAAQVLTSATSEVPVHVAGQRSIIVLELMSANLWLR